MTTLSGQSVVEALRQAPWPELEAAHLGHLRCVGESPAAELVDVFGARVVAQLAAAGVGVTALRGRDARLWLARLPAARPAFGPGQRQALLVGACLDPSRPWPASAAPDPHTVAIARGGLLAAHALALLPWLAAQIGEGRLATGRDLMVVFEGADVAPSGAWSEPGQTSSAPGPVEARPEVETEMATLLSPCACAIAEAGGWPLRTEGGVFLPVAVGRKGVVRLRVRARGEAVEPGSPTGQDAVTHLLAALSKLTTHVWPLQVGPAARAFVHAVAEQQTLVRSLALRALLSPATHARSMRRLSTGEQTTLQALLHDTLTVTCLSAGERSDVGAQVADATLDVRLVPGRSTADLIADLRRLLGEHMELEILQEAPGVQADLHTPLLRTLCEVLETHWPGARAAPSLETSDAPGLAWRQTQIPCYGFAPVALPEDVDFGARWRGPGVAVQPSGLAWGLRAFSEAIVRFLVEG